MSDIELDHQVFELERFHSQFRSQAHNLFSVFMSDCWKPLSLEKDLWDKYHAGLSRLRLIHQNMEKEVDDVVAEFIALVKKEDEEC